MTRTFRQVDKKNWPAFIALALLLGVLLRLSFPLDIEYKEDEKFMFEHTQQIGITKPWPLLGMTSGVDVTNPAMGIWIFVVLTKLSHASTPPELARAVQLMNILALFLLAFFAFRLIPKPERIPWYWATAFAAVNPFAVLLERKIWAQSTLPLFCILMWIAWHYRRHWAGAFFWGLLGACLGQIHMSGFFLAGGVFLWTVYHDRRANWFSWVFGSLVGAIPLVPWVQYMIADPGTSANRMKLLWVIYPKYWIFWVTDSLGMGLAYSLRTHQFMDFLRYPLIEETGTYLVGILHLIVIVIGVKLLISVKKNGGFSWGARDASETGLIVNSVLFAAGILMTLSFVELRRHYLIVVFPLEWVWLARLANREPRVGQKYLMAIWVAQLLITTLFLIYIHMNHGAVRGDYGTAYQFQVH